MELLRSRPDYLTTRFRGRLILALQLRDNLANEFDHTVLQACDDA
jgi:hypothetical protein